MYFAVPHIRETVDVKHTNGFIESIKLCNRNHPF